MSNRVQRKFKRAMNKISRQERSKKRFFSFLENDLITGYYAKRKSDKLKKAIIKVLKFIMCGILVVLGISLILLMNLGERGTSNFSILLTIISAMSGVLLLFGLLHPQVIYAADAFKSRYDVFKLFGSLTAVFIILDFYNFFVGYINNDPVN